MNKNSVQQQALPCIGKKQPPRHAGGGGYLPLLPLYPLPILTHPKLPAQSVKVILQCIIIIIIIKSPSSSSHPIFCLPPQAGQACSPCRREVGMTLYS